MYNGIKTWQLQEIRVTPSRRLKPKKNFKHLW